ncbi:MAG: hypothetical protein J7J16_03015 [Deltaproteobacteria bacterium]|nr:hypothetical protein [Deltaproteobacteria bacterium]
MLHYKKIIIISLMLIVSAGVLSCRYRYVTLQEINLSQVQKDKYRISVLSDPELEMWGMGENNAVLLDKIDDNYTLSFYMARAERTGIVTDRPGKFIKTVDKPSSIYVISDSSGNTRGYLFIQSMLHPTAFENEKEILIVVENPFKLGETDADELLRDDNGQ